MSMDLPHLFQRMTIIGVILSFRELLQEALNAQLEERIPYLYSTILDFHEHASLPEQSGLVRNNYLTVKPYYQEDNDQIDMNSDQIPIF
jgi:Membrane-associated apoptosis protein